MRFFAKGRPGREAFGPGPRSDVPSLPAATPLNVSNSFIEHHLDLKRRQDSPVTADVSTCGYLNGNASVVRTANSGFDCRVDTAKAIWGFCPTTVISPDDCGLAGGCVDDHGCKSGCGILGFSDVTTFTCSEASAQYCSTALLIDGPDQTYTYLACSTSAITDTYFNTPTSSSSSSTTSSASASSGAKPSLTSATSTVPATTSSPVSTSSSTLWSPLPSLAAAPKPPNNTGAIVGGVLGGLALLLFIVVALLFYRKLRTRHVNYDQDQQPTWQNTDVKEERSDIQGGLFKKPLKEDLAPAELPSNESAAELSGGKTGETTELPNNVRRGRSALRD